ncbi:hypothetical protein R83H12_00776 [Fibrobacteria bacterium R8-3-H12]
MLIANPIYDTVFKHLLENQRATKFFIGTIEDKNRAIARKDAELAELKRKLGKYGG